MTCIILNARMKLSIKGRKEHKNNLIIEKTEGKNHTMKRYFLTALIAVFALAGCGKSEPIRQPSGAEVSPQASQAATATPAARKKPVAVAVKTGLCEAREASEEGGLSIYNAFNNKVDLFETTGIHAIVCRDEVSGIVYYVNMGADYFLYRIRDGKAELAVALPANNLCTKDGAIYFLIDSYGKYELEGMQEGDIYCYTPENGEVSLVYEAEAVELRAEEDALYYLTEAVYQEDGLVSATLKTPYRLPYGGTVPEQDNSLTMAMVWQEYAPEYVMKDGKISGINLWRKGEQEDRIQVLDVRPTDFCVFSDQFIYSEGAKIGFIDLLTGERESYDLAEYFPSFQGKVHEFAMTEGNLLWATEQSNLYCINTETKEAVCYQKTAAGASIRTFLLTDGLHLYTLYYEEWPSKEAGRLVRLECKPGEEKEGQYTAVFLTGER